MLSAQSDHRNKCDKNNPTHALRTDCYTTISSAQTQHHPIRNLKTQPTALAAHRNRATMNGQNLPKLPHNSSCDMNTCEHARSRRGHSQIQHSRRAVNHMEVLRNAESSQANVMTAAVHMFALAAQSDHRTNNALPKNPTEEA